MKRLLAQIGLTAFSVLAVAFYLPESIVIILVCACAAAFGVLMIIPKTRRKVFIPVMAITAALACAVNLCYTAIAVDPVREKYPGSDRHIEAVLADEMTRSDSLYYYPLRVTTIDGGPADVKLKLTTARPLDIELFDSISFTADVYQMESGYYLSKGYYLGVSAYDSEFKVTETESRPFYYSVVELRRALRDALDEYLPEEDAALCKAVFIGDKYALSTDVRDEFLHVGASHLVVVSGLHFSVMCMILMYLFRSLEKRRGSNRFIRFGIMSVVTVVYMAVTGFQPSVIRSGVMMLVYILAEAFRRINDPYSSLGAAALVSIAVFSPYGAGDIGLILSFAATFAIITWFEPIYEKLKIRFKHPQRCICRITNWLVSLFSVSLAANILVIPISLIAFGGVSTLTLLTSVIFYPLIWVILLLSLLLCLLYYLGPLRYISLLLSWPLYLCTRVALIAVHYASALPFSYVHVSGVFIYVWLGLTVLMGAVVIADRKRYRLLPYAALLSVIILLAGTVTKSAYELNALALEVYDCKGGMAVGLDIKGKLYMFSFDANNAQAHAVSDRLASRYSGIRLAVCPTKNDFKNYARVADREFAISDYLLYDTDVNGAGASLNKADESAVYVLDEDAELRVYTCGKKLLSYITAGDVTILVIPGQFSVKNIPEQCRGADIMVIKSAEEGYDELSCSTLILCSPDGGEQEVLPSHNDILYTGDGDVTVDLR